MRRAGTYLRLQFARALRMLPQMLAVTLALAVLTGLGALLLSAANKDGDSAELVRVGLVADMEDPYISEALVLLKNMSGSGFSFSFEPMDRQTADRLLRRGELDGCAVIPEGFAEALMAGEHRPATYVSANGGADVGAQMTRELVETVSSLVLETENAVYGAQDFAAEHLKQYDPYSVGDYLVFQYAIRIADRSRLFVLDTIGTVGTLSLQGYYLCGLALLFLLFWSISCAPLFSSRSRELGRILQAQGLPAVLQVLSEYLSYVFLMLLGLLALFAIGAAVLPRLSLRIPELEHIGALRFAFRALPTALMICALQFFLFELADGTVGGVLLQFLNAAVQGYLAGCFYPSSFFPDALRNFGAVLPAGVGMSRLRSVLLEENGAAAAVWVWMLGFLLFAAALRFRRNRR